MIGDGSPDSPSYLKFLAGAITGGVGSVIGNPFDVCKTLAQTNTDKSVNLGALVGNMYRDQGIAGILSWRRSEYFTGMYIKRYQDGCVRRYQGICHGSHRMES